MKSSTPARDWTSANLLAGPLAFGLMLALPVPSAPYPVRCAIGLLLWMTWWWLTRPVHLAVTSFLPLAVGAAFNFVPMANLLHAYSEEMIILLIGANIITTAWTRWGVDRRVGLASALAVGTNPRTQIVVWFLIATGLSAVLPNTVVAATLIPIVIVMCHSMGIDDIAASAVGTGLVLAVAWGSSVGGFATPLGGAMNLLAMKLVQDSATHHEFFFTTWTTRMLPLTVVLVLVTTVFMAFAFRMRNERTLQQADLQREWEGLGPWSSGGKWSLMLFAVASTLAFTRQLYSAQLPVLTPAYSFLICGLACFAIRPQGKPLLDWEYAQSRMMWGLFYLFAGGTALGEVLNQTGAAKYVADQVTPYAAGGGFAAVLIFSVVTIVVAQVTSHVAAIAIVVPITISTFQQLGLNPIPFVYIVAAIGNCGYVLPSSSGGTAVAGGYGVNLKTMAAYGVWLSIVSAIALLLMGYILTIAWPGFGLA